MYSRKLSALVAFLCGIVVAAPLSAQSVQEFQLPPSPQETATPNVQGPVDTDGPVPLTPREIVTETPSQETSDAQPSDTQIQFEPILTAPEGSSADDAIPTESARPPQTQRSIASPVEAIQPPEILPSNAAQPAPSSVEQTTELAPTVSQSAPAQVPNEVGETLVGVPMLWLWLAGVAALLLLAFVTLLQRRKVALAQPPRIDPPMPARDREGAEPEPTGTISSPIGIKVEAISFERSFINVTLTYRVTLLNHTDHALRNVSLEAELTSAGSTTPIEAQIAAPNAELPHQQSYDRLSARQSARFEGQIRLPVNAANIIRQGNAALVVPLLKLRVIADALEPVAKTWVIGQPSEFGGARLQPFGLHEGPRSWKPIAQRELD